MPRGQTRRELPADVTRRARRQIREYDKRQDKKPINAEGGAEICEGPLVLDDPRFLPTQKFSHRSSLPDRFMVNLCSNGGKLLKYS